MSEPTASQGKQPTARKDTAPVKKTEKSGQSRPAPKPPRNEKKNAGGGGAALWLSLLALAASIGLAVAGYFFWDQQRQLRSSQRSILNQVDSKLAGVDETVNRVKSGFDSLKTGEDKNRDALKEKLDRLAEGQRNQNSRLNKLTAVMGRSNQDWGLAEVEYLLKLAIDRVQLLRDARTALVALDAADQRLHELADPRFTEVRQQIAQQRHALERLPDVDRAGLAATLSAMIARLDNLPVGGSDYQARVQQPAGADASSTGGDSSALKQLDWRSWQDWQQLPAVIWDALRQLVTIREHDRPVQPMLPPENENFLRMNLRLQLEAARFALLREDPVLYQQTLDTAKGWLDKYFATDDSAVKAVREQLDELASVNIRPELPDISQPLIVLRQQMKLAGAQVSPAQAKSPLDNPVRPAVSGPATTEAAGNKQ